LYILAATVLLVGIVVSVATNGRQFYPALVVAIVLAAAGLIFSGRRR
jgi:hypothetical protein